MNLDQKEKDGKKSQKAQNNQVYVGNIAYNAKEEEIEAILRLAGPVLKFNLKGDENGKKKGYGFGDYFDHETTLSAIKNLNGMEFQGRILKVDFPDKHNKEGNQKQEKGQKNSWKNDLRSDFEPIQTSEREKRSIADTLDNLSRNEKIFLLTQLKEINEVDPKFMLNLLENNKELTKKILQIQNEIQPPVNNPMSFASSKQGSQSSRSINNYDNNKQNMNYKSMNNGQNMQIEYDKKSAGGGGRPWIKDNDPRIQNYK